MGITLFNLNIECHFKKSHKTLVSDMLYVHQTLAGIDNVLILNVINAHTETRNEIICCNYEREI